MNLPAEYLKEPSSEVKMELEKLKEIIADVLSIDAEDITEETSFADDLGADSLDVAQIMIGISDEFCIDIPDHTIEGIQTVGDAVEAIRNAK